MAYTSINTPTDYFNTVPYNGVNSSQSITGVGFQPNFTWIKCRNNGQENMLFDSVRGVTNYLQSDTTIAEATNANSLTSFDSDGFSLGFLGEVNVGAYTYVAWNWLAGGTVSSNTDGSITSSVSANTTAGFSIVSYTGTLASATVGHGLGAVPKVIIVKNKTTVDNWAVYTAMTGNTSKLRLNGTNATITGISSWDSTTPTSSVFSLGSDSEVNNNTATIAYCFAEKKGFSKFGTYTGNNSTNGPMIYTGFKPAWLLIKATNAAQWWTLLDNKRDTYNQASLGLSPNSNTLESTFNTDRGPHYIDFLSNGFKIRTDNSGVNGTNSFIYMAFAESPFTTSTGIPTTAR